MVGPAVLGIKFHGIHLGHSELEARAQIDPQTCVQYAKDIGVYHGIYSAPCTRLVGDCLTQAKTTQDPWAQASCVSAATCQGTTAVTSLLQCQDPSFDPTQAPSLKKALFANLAQCDSCDLSFQNYVDFVYGELSAIGSQDWPSYKR
ncbi:hypothetical protein CYLTODRAFT_233489 [Cylindrobasidium torrendii FP15055 ss-10]|uniref:Uncharacterized protein n=1 Tax=Cylindrobasidium torrendii FP15055 ss-10 TaxID=1314674 RepID=A0A0D7AVG3_9AGAR|nr:hypothetical protein CYLTODRAFT_233489 [Cylindrobasidium torrendii FP15055 ss-10]